MSNYLQEKRFMKSNCLCKCGIERDEESHIMSCSCPDYGDIRNNDTEIVNIFSEVLERMDSLLEEDKQ